MNSGSGQPNAKDAKEIQNSQKEDNTFVGDFTHEIIGAAVEVQRVLGHGLLESAYAGALAIEMASRGLRFEREVPIAATYKGQSLGTAFRADFIVERSVILELKASEGDPVVFRAQLLSYLRMTDVRIGLLINFHAQPVVKGIHRVVNQP
jgi:GxxExxY protein